MDYIFEYNDADSFDDLDHARCRQVYAVCLYNSEIVIGFDGKKANWGLIGGTIEEGEIFEQTLRREIQEESNMEILNFLSIGYQKVLNTKDNSYFYQLRYICKTKPYGQFVSDPAGSVTEIKLIDPKDYKKYFDWGKIGERIIRRSLKLSESF